MTPPDERPAFKYLSLSGDIEYSDPESVYSCIVISVHAYGDIESPTSKTSESKTGFIAENILCISNKHSPKYISPKPTIALA